MIDVMVPISPVDPATIKRKVASLSPARGATPIAASLKLGAEVLKPLEGSKTVVLISDGEETCEGDPVAAARETRDEIGAAFVVHVVGFDVGEEERTQLSAIADAGGGSYYDARTALALARGLQEIKQKVVDEVPEVQEVQASAGPVFILNEEFDDDQLESGLQILNRNDDYIFIDEGKLTLISTDRKDNRVIYIHPLPKNFVAETTITRATAHQSEQQKNDKTWTTLSLVHDKDNFVSVSIGGDCCDSSIGSPRGYYTLAWFNKKLRGKLVPRNYPGLIGPSVCM